MKAMVRGLLVLGGAGVGAALLVSPAAAHVSPDKSEVPAGAYTSVSLTVGHGCDSSSTRQVTVQVPDGINNVTPAVLPGWDIEITTEALAEPVEGSHGEEVTERESQVTFTAQAGNELRDGFRQSYTLGFQAPETPGEYLFFKTIQTCVEGETAWIQEYTGEGEEPEHPSPAVLVTAAEGDDHDEDLAEGDAAAEEIATEPAATTSDASGGDDSTGLAVAGIAIGALGLVTGGTALARSRRSTS